MGLSSTTTTATTDTIEPPPVQVYVRVRPLIKEEDGHTLMDYKIKNGGEEETPSSSSSSSSARLHVKIPAKKRAINPAFYQAAAAPPPRFLLQREDWKVFEGFTRVLGPESTNEMVYNATILQPCLLLTQVVTRNQSACIFTYGHTGSGKSHTLLGYEGRDEDSSLGIYKYAARDLLAHLEELNNDVEIIPNNKNEDHPKRRVLLVRISELYKDKARDLLTGDDCSIREDKQGVAKVRGPMIEDEVGRIDQKPLGRLCRTPEEVVACVDEACESRRVGTSTHHSQSSRSHLVLEFEVVTPELVEQRNLVALQDTHLTRLLWLQTERMFGKHVDRAVPKWTEEFTALKVRTDIKTYQGLVNESKKKLDELEKGLGGTLVFCDLAGNEYARDAAGSTKAEMEESAEINKSLLAVKEMIRSLNNNNNNNNPGKQHVSYRDSKLSIMLRRHVQGNGSRAVMLGHISPSQEYIRKTINTLTYCSMVVGGNGATTAGSKNSRSAVTTTTRKGKENKP
jgi:hypothetical protein